MHPTIPVIDIHPFLSGDEASQRAVAAAVDRACREVGFLVVTGHGVSPALLERAHAAARTFFDLDEAVKNRYQPPPGGFTGYRGLASEGLSYSLDQASLPDLKEAFTVSCVDRSDSPYYTSELGRMYIPDNPWPGEVADLVDSWTELYREMDRVSSQLMRIFAVALALPITFFDDKLDRNISCIRAINYPAQVEPPLPGQLRVGAHSDYGSLTLLSVEDAPGGLEVQRSDGEWEPVTAPRGALVTNIGDLMAQWTNDTWRSTLHRVVNPPRELADGARRQSLVFFHQPNYDAEVVPLPSCVGPDRPAKYGRTTSGEHLFMKMTKAKNRNV